MSTPNVSVVMATYNGAHFLTAQLDTILSEIGPADELIIVDDASTDATVELAVGRNDPRIHVVRHTKNIGHVATFEHGLRLARGRIIMPSDQDDVWPVGRVQAMTAAMNSARLCVGSLRILSADPLRNGEIVSLRATSPGRAGDLRAVTALFLGQLPYFGSAMAFTAKFRDLALPFPEGTVAHDHWLALLGHCLGEVARLEEPVILRREHGANLSGRHRTLFKKLRYRIHLAALCEAAVRRCVVRRS